MTDALAMKLIQMANGYRISRLLFVAAELGVADLLAGEPQTAEDLAAALGMDGLSLRRVMRALASLELFTEDDRQRFSLTPLGAALKSDASGSARAAVRTLAGQPFWRAWEHVLYCVETGKPGFEKAWDGSVRILQVAPRAREGPERHHGGVPWQ